MIVPTLVREGRALLVLLAMSGCAGPPRPTVVRTLSSLPTETLDRQEALDSAQARPTAESRKPLPPKVRKVETAAATAAAVLGSIFSLSTNALVGFGGPLDENLLIDPTYRRRPTGAAPEQAADADADARAGEDYDAGELVPWIRVTPAPAD